MANEWNSLIDLVKLPPKSIFLVDGKNVYEEMKRDEERNKAINKCLDYLKFKDEKDKKNS